MTPLSAKISFVRIDAADVKFTGDNQRAWISFFKVPRIIYVQEAMENFVFPDEIKAKLMKMSKLMNIFYVP